MRGGTAGNLGRRENVGQPVMKNGKSIRIIPSAFRGARRLIGRAALVAAVAAAVRWALSSSGCRRSESRAAKVIGFGRRIALERHLQPGKINIVDFFSEYCPPCRRLSPKLEALDAARDDVVVIRVDINRPDVRGIDWNSPLARQLELESIPYLRIYDKDGTLIASGEEAFRRLETLFDEAGIRW